MRRARLVRARATERNLIRGRSRKRYGRRLRGTGAGVTDLPIHRIEQTIHPTADQVTSLEHLKAAFVTANDILKASSPARNSPHAARPARCRREAAGAMMQAVQIVRGPLDAFYNSLTDDRSASSRPWERRNLKAEPGQRLADLCDNGRGVFPNCRGAHRTDDPADSPTRIAFDNLKSASSRAASEIEHHVPARCRKRSSLGSTPSICALPPWCSR